MEFTNELKLLQLMLSRLERISVDSRLAHRASGLRGSLLTLIDNIDKRRIVSLTEKEQRLIDQGFYILERAASERVQGGRISRV
jgi:hypothetical protein